MLRLTNTLTKKLEPFIPSHDVVTIYACGPTVYDYVHIGNLRTFTMTDVLVRSLHFLGYKTKFVMNVTDVGHLVSDSDEGEDKMEKGARREGKSAWDIAKFFTDAFISDVHKLNILDPDVRPKPTEHIPEQIEMVQTLLSKGYAYQIDDGIYFDTSKFDQYGALTGQSLEDLKAGARVEINEQKKNPTDFALWKFSPKNEKRQMEWESPWGMGFPGWHIECSAMAKKHLGDQIDIHTGGMDLVPVHHTNEIAQSEATTGKAPYVRYWVHGQFIMVDGEKMAKSKGNFYRLADIETKGFDPMSLRYFYMTAQYRAFQNFTWEGLIAARQSYQELLRQYASLRDKSEEQVRTQLSEEKLASLDAYRKKFTEALENDLNMPQALAATWEVAKSNLPSQDKKELLESFDEVLGLNLTKAEHKQTDEIPEEIQRLMLQREAARTAKNFALSDQLRDTVQQKGYIVEDLPSGASVKKNEKLKT